MAVSHRLASTVASYVRVSNTPELFEVRITEVMLTPTTSFHMQLTIGIETIISDAVHK
jgi:hypothetical protein